MIEKITTLREAIAALEHVNACLQAVHEAKPTVVSEMTCCLALHLYGQQKTLVFETATIPSLLDALSVHFASEQASCARDVERLARALSEGEAVA